VKRWRLSQDSRRLFVYLLTSKHRVREVVVMAGLVPAIHDFPSLPQDVDARDKPGHDGAVVSLLPLE